MYVVRASYGLVQATVGVGTVLIWYYCVAYTRGGGVRCRPGLSPCAGWLYWVDPANHNVERLSIRDSWTRPTGAEVQAVYHVEGVRRMAVFNDTLYVACKYKAPATMDNIQLVNLRTRRV